MTVREILHPRSVAVIGASDNRAKFGGRIMHYLTKHGFAGRIVPVNPGRREVFGRQAYPRIGEAGPVDVAILAVPPDILVESAAECADAGVGCIVVMTTGFAEAGPDGAARQEELVLLSRRKGMRVVGPNCMGFINPHHHLALTSSLVLDVDTLLAGEIGLVSQSGALMVSMYNRAHDAGIAFSACVSLGNQSDLEIGDFLEYMVDDPQTRVICLYVEGLKDPARFLRLAEACRTAGKPLLVVKVGRTDAGVRAARSHTASLAGSWATFQAACRDRGILLVDDPDGMVRVAEVLRRWGAPGGDGIGILSPSGGGAAIAVDRVVERGLRLARLAPTTRERLLEILLPPQADNPIDLGGRRESDAVPVAGQAMAILAGDPDVTALLVMLTTVPAYEATTRELAKAAVASGKPVFVVVTPGSAADGPRRVLHEAGCAPYESLDEALRVLALAVAAGRRSPPPDGAARPPAVPLPALRPGPLTEPEAKALLRACGVPVPRERLAASADEAAAAAEAVGYPVVLKGVARGVVHKSDVGAVKLGLTDAEAVRQAWYEVTAALGAHQVEGCLVSEQVRGEAEVIVGAKRDPQFGAVVLVGLGGLLVELVGDLQIALAPITPAHALRLLRALRLWPVLVGARGRPPCDTGALADIVSRVSWLAVELGDRLVELDVNPILVRAAGLGAVAVDARATLA
jgi:acetyl-CoA synthetase (ADP-forming)